MLIIKLLFSVVAGFAAHALWRPSKKFGERWGNLVRYAVGLGLFIPSQISVKSSMPRAGEPCYDSVERDFISGILAAFAIGIGVFFGYLVDGDSDD